MANFFLKKKFVFLFFSFFFTFLTKIVSNAVTPNCKKKVSAFYRPKKKFFFLFFSSEFSSLYTFDILVKNLLFLNSILQKKTFFLRSFSKMYKKCKKYTFCTKCNMCFARISPKMHQKNTVFKKIGILLPLNFREIDKITRVCFFEKVKKRISLFFHKSFALSIRVLFSYLPPCLVYFF